MNKLINILTGYVMPLLMLAMLFGCILIYLHHHGHLLPCYNQ